MSLCKYCRKPIIWVAKPEGLGWFPPFDMPEGLERMKYQLIWSPTGDWVAEPQDKSHRLQMTVHTCEERETYLAEAWQHRMEVTPTRINPVLLDELADQGIIEERVVEKIVEPTQEQQITRARKLAVKCPVCKVKQFEWCVYLKTGQPTRILHQQRGIN